MKTRSIAKLTMRESVWKSTLMSRIGLCSYMLQESDTSLSVSDNWYKNVTIDYYQNKWEIWSPHYDFRIETNIFLDFLLYQIRTQFNGANVRLSYFKNFCLCSIKNEYVVIMFWRHIIWIKASWKSIFFNFIFLFFRYAFVLIKVLCSRKEDL